MSQITGTKWSPHQLMEWLEAQTPQLKGIVIAMLRWLYPQPERLGLPTGLPARLDTRVVPAKPRPPTVPLLSADGCHVGKRHSVAN
ncbi:hypothetical protein AERO8C_20229 [Aeromonas veronii]|uniref:Uncharacterized protein n=1 Tax=Aeromonas veronii TaxID=654 RepID=A0A653L0B7_AERVE|nr:hypothetical protein AERO8C_20229 [Aeromonas veronii]